jgi:hypothetical protein
MTRLRTRRGVAAAITTVAALSLAAVAEAGPTPPTVPSQIQVGAGHKVFLVGHAVGVQIYPCNATAGGFAWGATTPRANLYDKKGKLIATHFGGPTWQAKDGSTVVGQRVDGVTVDPTAIPWLKLSALSTSAGQHGKRLTRTTFIQRTATVGGLPPAPADCNAATVGTLREVPYTADYYFWKAKRA